VTILVIDDDAAFVASFERLAKLRGFTVEKAFDGEAGLKAAAEKQPDCIILDVMMPRVDGRDAMKRLKAGEATRRIPVIMYSARGDHDDRITGLELGADDYIAKPFDPDMLLRRVEYLVWKRREGKD